LKEVIVSNFSKTTSGSRVLFLFSWQSTKRKLEVAAVNSLQTLSLSALEI
jgi:hypothetical protein